MNWQVGFANEECIPGATISGAAVGVAVVESVRGGILVRALETVKSADLARRMQHVCMDVGARYDVSPRVCGPSQPGFCWGADFVRCVPTAAGTDMERLRALLAAGVVRLPNGHETVRRAGTFVAAALPQEPPAGAFIDARCAILAGGDGGPVGLALTAAIIGLDPIPEPPAAPAAPVGVWRTGPH